METVKKNRSGTTDLTVGRPLAQILRFALPLVLGTLFQQLYSFADTIIVGRCLGTDALGGCRNHLLPELSDPWLYPGSLCGIRHPGSRILWSKGS